MGKTAVNAAAEPASSPFVPTESQLVVAYSVCRSIARSSAKNFYYAFLVLPPPKRQALCAVYAFMRRCDDIADEPGLPMYERRQKLEAWLDSFHRAASGLATDDPVLLGLTDSQRRFGIPIELLDQLAYGTEMDVGEDDQLIGESNAPILTVRYKTFEDLRLYCYRVASVVGLVCIRVFGYRDRRAEALAEKLGLAFQLTNIIRDVKEDAAMGRIYFPEEDLAKFGISPGELGSAAKAKRLRPLLEMEARRAFEYYRAGDQLIPLVEEDSQPALWVLVTIYRRLLQKIASRRYDVLSGKVTLPLGEKLAVLVRGLFRRLV
ncbi:MAG TPA: phytoene/squalene synthase family protein [Terriglobales bacterium]|nr:phytoene/squalene synthase family protein [Terriglobales bacterium]